jgi:hypothetical protein
MMGGSNDRPFFGGRKKINALASTCQYYSPSTRSELVRQYGDTLDGLAQPV